jgi:hypothetical protein
MEALIDLALILVERGRADRDPLVEALLSSRARMQHGSTI